MNKHRLNRFRISLFLILLFAVNQLPAQDIFIEKIDNIRRDTFMGLLKNGVPFEGFFEVEDTFGFEKILNQSFQLDYQRIEKELIVPIYFFEKKVDVQIRDLKVEFKNGQPNGSVTAYDWDGNIIFEATLKNGILHGKYTSYHRWQKDGRKPFVKVNYKNGKKEGKVIYTSEKGKLLGKAIYKKDQPRRGKFYNSPFEFQKYKFGKLQGIQFQGVRCIDEWHTVFPSEEIPTIIFGKIYFNNRLIYIAKGVYKKGKPWNGQFHDAATRKLETLKKGKLIQRTYIDQSGWTCYTTFFNKKEEPIKQHFYTNGEQINFINDKLEAKGIYKDGKPYEGTFWEYNSHSDHMNESIYINGIIQEQLEENSNQK